MSREVARAIEKIAQKEGVSIEFVRKEIEHAIKLANSTNKPWMKRRNLDDFISAMAHQVLVNRRISK